MSLRAFRFDLRVARKWGWQAGGREGGGDNWMVDWITETPTAKRGAARRTNPSILNCRWRLMPKIGGRRLCERSGRGRGRSGSWELLMGVYS